ncbi:uncharacterized protein BX663DRAFT_547384 [Cokeromyces recurvatus]|uniref:uncharacterized protein n=1 Tax=Cokeromyces recurvatus TaxID=90255 RepID=UPI00221FEE95|nr:uncharacterized protein BX663DRAFT_547384 [Cokeromyces recurvatus]KAI7907690.1 hypothetical protein BX663DRAFT_547384 [Cokeromyces recurvatus]
MTTTFYFEDRMDNLFNEHGERVYDPMEGVLTENIDPNIVLEIITKLAARFDLANKPAEKKSVVKEAKTSKERILFENPKEKGNIIKFSKELLVNPCTAER